jgi:DNA-binding transcriptional MerR regulator
VWVLKQLDKEGIVSPPRLNDVKVRLYSKRELGKLDRIWYLMSQRKVKVDGIKVILEMELSGYQIND